MFGAAEMGVIGIIFLGLWAIWSGIVDGIKYKQYQEEKKKQEERNRNNWR